MSSLFVRKRGNIYNVVVEFKDARGKTKQKSIDKFKNIEDANRRKKELLQDAIFIKKYRLENLSLKYETPINHEGFFVYRFLSVLIIIEK